MQNVRCPCISRELDIKPTSTTKHHAINAFPFSAVSYHIVVKIIPFPNISAILVDLHIQDEHRTELNTLNPQVITTSPQGQVSAHNISPPAPYRCNFNSRYCNFYSTSKINHTAVNKSDTPIQSCYFNYLTECMKQGLTAVLQCG